MAPILGFVCANVTSTGPPVRSTRITGRFAAAATAAMRLCCIPGSRRLVLSRPSLSCRWLSPMNRNTCSTEPASATAWSVAATSHAAELHPARNFTSLTKPWRPLSGVMDSHGGPK
uniref:Uncharacterized protein n=1 Tax=Arundo donax TaxID=35708 RepID=A0A0A9E1Y0_ARUDO